MKLFIKKQRPAVFFLLMLLILLSTFHTGYAQAIDPPLSERTPQIRDAIVAAVPGVNNADDVTAAHLAAITSLNPAFTGITSLKSGDFNGLTALTYLNLSGNSIGDISVLEDLTTLTSLFLAATSISDISALESLTALKELYLTHNAISDISVLQHLTALTELSLGENSVSDISVLANLTALKTLILDHNAISDVSVLENLTTLEFLSLNKNPISDYGPLRRLIAAVKAAGRSLTLDITIPPEFQEDNDPKGVVAESPASSPVFTEGTTATRTVAENTAASVNIGSTVAATDADNDTLIYTLSGTDASSFSILSTSGQLQTRAALDFETKSSYSVTVEVSDGNGGSTSIAVTINVSDVNEAPVFSQGTHATLSVAEQTASGRNIGVAFTATDPDSGDTLTYSLRRGDRNSFRIDPNTGQLQTRAALDYETKRSYNDLAVRVTDSGGLTDAIVVTINVTDVDENRAPSFTDGSTTTRSVAENTGSGQDIGSAVAATDPDTGDTLTYTLGGKDAASFSIDSTNGQLQTSGALDYEAKLSYTVRITVSDSKLTDTIDVTINVTNINEAPSFTEGSTATRSIAENTAANTNIGTAVTAADVDANTTLTYTLGGADASSFSIVSTSGQLQTNAVLDYEAKSSYSVTITVSDTELTDTIDVTIDVTDVDENRAPSFSEGNRATRSIAENTGSGQDIGSAVSATDPDNDTLTYILGGKDAESFRIDDTNGQLQTRAALDYETKTSYTVTITVSDSELIDTIDVTINVTDVNENRAPEFNAGSSTTRSIAENTGSGVNIGSPVAATDADTSNTLTYTLGGTDESSFSIVDTNGQLQTKAALDYETKASYSVKVSVSDGNGSSDSIDVTITVTNVNEAPSFANSTATRSIAENTAANTNIGTAISATDPDTGDTLTYTLGGADAAAFRINSTNGRLKTRAALDYETKTSYSVRITVSDSELTDTIDVTVNVTDVDENRAPSFADGASTTRSVAENTAANTNIGSAVAATDPDDDTLTYTLGGTDAASFSIVSTSGQLQTNAALDYESKSSYSVRITVSDSKLTDTIDVTINVTDVDENRAPAFTDGDNTTRSVVENTDPGVNIGSPVSATDPDNDTLTYTLGGTNAAAFSIVSFSGQLRTRAALDYETKSSYAVTVSVSDSNSGSDNISVTINVIDAPEAINRITPLRQRTPQVRNAIVAAAGVRSPEDVSEAHLAAITLLDLRSKDITSLKSGDFDGLTALTTLYLHKNSISDVSPLEHLTSLETLYLYENSISDISPLENLTALIKLTLSDNSIKDIPRFEDLTNLTDLYLKNNSISDISPLENLTSLKFLILDSNSISDISPLENLTNLDNLYLSENSIKDISPLENLTNLTDLYLNSNSISDISSLENLTNLDDLHLYSNSISDISPLENLTSLVVLGLDKNSIKDISPLENMTSLVALGLASNSISDILPLENMTALVWLSLKDNPISDYEPLQRLKTANPGVFIDITLNNNPPQFIEGNSTTRTIAENTAAGTNIGEAVTATDADNHPLTYSLSGTDADAFDIVSTSGQLKTKAALDYETKNAYMVTVTVYDGNSGGDRITVTIDVLDDVTEAVDENGRAAPSIETSPIIPDKTVLLSNFPNPFNPETWIPYQLAEPAEVTLTIYDIRGVVVRELKLGYQTAGMYESRSRAIHWDGSNALGEKVATGVYFYTLKAGDFTATRTLLIRK